MVRGIRGIFYFPRKSVSTVIPRSTALISAAGFFSEERSLVFLTGLTGLTGYKFGENLWD